MQQASKLIDVKKMKYSITLIVNNIIVTCLYKGNINAYVKNLNKFTWKQ